MAKRPAEMEQWDRYWAYGNIHSFSQVAAGNYQGRVAAFWRTRFEALRDGDGVLDVATGNGAVALLALETADRLSRRLEVTGIDLADISPSQQVRDPSLADALGRISFQGRTAAEAMPFGDHSFDLICSQFGLEYTDLSRSIPEIGRVLRPRGRLAAIVHHRDSMLLQATREELAQLDFVLNDVKLYLRARNLLRGMKDAPWSAGAGGSVHPKLRRKHRALQDAMERVHRAAEASDNPSMLIGPARYVREIFGAFGRKPAAELLEWLEEARRRVVANQRRLLDMTEAAKGEADLPGIRRQLEEARLERVELAVFEGDNGGVLGWRLEAAKSPGGA